MAYINGIEPTTNTFCGVKFLWFRSTSFTPRHIR